MYRWSLLLTRFAILLLILVAIWIGRDPLVRKIITSKAQSTIGAKVEIGHARTLFADGKIILKDVAIADPRNPMRNLVQADSAVLRLDISNLFHRKICIEDGSTSQLVFGAPRSSSGSLIPSNDPSGHSVEREIRISMDDADPQQAWLDRFKFSGGIQNEKRFQVSLVATDIFNRLDEKLNDHASNIETLKSSIRGIYDLVNFGDNPLRQYKLQTANQRLDQLRSEIDLIASGLTELDQQVALDRTKLTEARNKDLKTLQSNSSQKLIDGKTLSRLLLNENQAQQAKNILRWYFSFRDAVPDPQTDFHHQVGSGRNVQIPGVPPTPAFFIKSMQLDGEGRIAGTKFNFSGIANNISTQPQLLDVPATFNLRAQGNTHFVIECELDRRGATPKDVVNIRCPDFPIASRVLGHDQTLQVSVSPCRTQVDIRLECIDDELSGTMDFSYDNLVMQIEHLDELAGGKEIADRINLELASIANYKVNATIDGSIANPKIKFDSDLGSKFAAKMNEVIENDMLIAKQRLNEILRQHLSRLENEMAKKIELVSMRLENDIIRQENKMTADLRSRMLKDPFSRSEIR